MATLKQLYYDTRAQQIEALVWQTDSQQYEEQMFDIIGFVLTGSEFTNVVVKMPIGIGSVSWNESEQAYELDQSRATPTEAKRAMAMTAFGVNETQSNLFHPLLPL